MNFTIIIRASRAMSRHHATISSTLRRPAQILIPINGDPLVKRQRIVVALIDSENSMPPRKRGCERFCAKRRQPEFPSHCFPKTSAHLRTPIRDRYHSPCNKDPESASLAGPRHLSSSRLSRGPIAPKSQPLRNPSPTTPWPGVTRPSKSHTHQSLRSLPARSSKNEDLRERSLDD